MSAKFVDALRGYEYFIDNRGKVSIEEINVFLMLNRRNSISQRTYTHYQSLMRYGFGSYFPINQFDVSRTLGQLPIAPDRRRYNRDSTDIDASISLDGIIWIKVKIIDKSLVSFGITTTDKITLKPRNVIWVNMNQYHNIPAILVWRTRGENQIRFGVRAFEFIANYRIPEKEIIVSRPTGSLIVKKISKGDITWREVHSIIGRVYEVIEASSALLKEIARLSKLSEFQIDQAILSSISFSSPFNIKIKVVLDLAKIIDIVCKWYFLGGAIKERYTDGTETIRVGNKRLDPEMEYRRHAIKPKRAASKPAIPHDLSSSLKDQIKDSLNIEELPFPLFDSDSIESGILNEQLIPAAIDLVAGDNPDIEIQVIEDDIENNED